jgi:hypothetical protein
LLIRPLPSGQAIPPVPLPASARDRGDAGEDHGYVVFESFGE